MAKNGDFASLMEASALGGNARKAPRLERGQDVEGTIVQVGGDTIFVDIGLPADARLDRSELASASGELAVKVGDRIRAKVLDASSDGPRLAISMGRSGAALDTSSLVLARDSGTPVEGSVTGAVKGGLEVTVGGVRAFCPASQVEAGFVEDLTSFVGQNLRFVVLEVRDGGKSVVVSRKKLLLAERAAQAESLRASLAVGQEVDAVVVATKPHGAIIDLGGLEGYIHISELTAGRVRAVEDVVKTGESVRARILSIESGDRGPRIRLSLVLGSAEAQPSAAEPPPNEVLTATVQSVNNGGLVVSTNRGEGFVPVRELELPPGADHRRGFPVGSTLAVVALGPATGGKLRLSAKQVRDVVERTNYQEFSRGGGMAPTGSFGSLGDLLREKLAKGQDPVLSRTKGGMQKPGAGPSETRSNAPTRRKP